MSLPGDAQSEGMRPGILATFLEKNQRVQPIQQRRMHAFERCGQPMTRRLPRSRADNDNHPGQKADDGQQNQDGGGRGSAGELPGENRGFKPQPGHAEHDANEESVFEKAQPLPPELGSVQRAIDDGEAKVHRESVLTTDEHR